MGSGADEAPHVSEPAARRKGGRRAGRGQRQAEFVSKLQAKFKLDPEVYRQHYQRLQENKELAPKRVAKSK